MPKPKLGAGERVLQLQRVPTGLLPQPNDVHVLPLLPELQHLYQYEPVPALQHRLQSAQQQDLPGGVWRRQKVRSPVR